ncbi:hypothetical protein A3A18_02990 [Candidatus Azambacteria bacterium RIFCSPLOWO2_01_FULL_44_84]|nr:MAG: hypothetical protein A3A18_02990 [Candidatus Azambacteria bacterium RIFCSPLOWO2_01_FULL_44_84]OGD32894.1 MAG: hypothetical protein A3C78_01020 [Candidatus Azambacteria bacterium RIFCSPHIGHO2_02_FULL_45_18]
MYNMQKMALKTVSKEKDFSKIPQTSGVYFFYDAKNKLLYIGKAINLRARIRSHFVNNAIMPAKSEMIKLVRKIDWQLTNSGIEALIAEAALIKKHRPFYNVALRDDKSYSFVEVTKEKFPRIFMTHQPKIRISKFEIRNKSKIQNSKHQTAFGFRASDFGFSTYIGPFTESGALKTVLSHLRRIFPYCTCPKPHARNCINAELGKCLRFCCDKNKSQNINHKSQTNYRKNIKNIIGILTGKKQTLLKNLRKEMARASREHNYESAALARDRVFGLEKIFSHRDVLTIENKQDLETRREVLEKIRDLAGLAEAPRRIEIYDISNIQGKFATGAMAIFEEGKPNKQSYRKFKIRFKKEPNDTGMIKEILARRLARGEWPLPDLFVIDGGRGQLNAALEVLKKFKIDMPIAALAKKEEELYLPDRQLPLKLKEINIHALHLLQQMRDEAHRFAVSYHIKLRKKLG